MGATQEVSTMKKVLGIAAVVIAVVVVYASMGGDSDKTPPAVATPTPQPQAPPQPAEENEPESNAKGNIKVTVTVKGELPPPAALNRKADPYCAKTKMIDPSILAKDGKLQNAVVRLIGKVKKPKGDMPAPVQISQKDCMYSPRVNTAMVGQEIAISNDDKTLHNVHAYKGLDTQNWFNIAQPPNAPPVKKILKDFHMATFQCDVHPWMNAYISITEHPYQGVSATDGTVVLKNPPVPNKAYKVASWHERLGVQKAEVIVKADETVEISLEYQAPAK